MAPLARSGGSLDPQGPVAETIAGLWWLLFWLGLAVFVVFAVMLGLALFRRDRDAAAEVEIDDEDDTTGRLARWFLGWGVIGPGVVIAVVFVATVAAMRAIPDEVPEGSLVVEVVGHQWFYEVTYPEQGVTVRNELHLPVGRDVALELTSADVIHSFWVPELAGKVDMLPERVNTLVLKADVAGEHQLRCAEFCGLDHTMMTMPVVVEAPERFERWLTERGSGGPADG